ncbi:MAG: prepilin-type N-terminal cleavage/methylation domain-containing protein, partial [Planctomycetes bacterium]|nr:prepilin-type N-terminal cleavage/methylation domain-containing protein [Planctomycetota bacterium]
MTAIAPNPHGLAMRRRGGARAGFSMTEMLIVMAIMTVLAASVIIFVPGLRTRAMRAQAGADIRTLSMAITQYREDKGGYPDRPYAPTNPAAPGAYDYMDRCLYEWLTNPSAGGSGNGWGGAKDTWEFLRGDSKTLKQILDPWSAPYYY